MGTYGGSGGGGGSSSGPKTYKPEPLGGGGGGSINVDKPAASSNSAGKGSIDMTDPASIGQALGSFAEFAGNIGGGIVGALGSIGPDGETASLGQAAEDIGRIPGGIGDIRLPYAGNDPTRQGATLAQGVGMVGDVISAPSRFLEHEAAKNRASGGPGLDPRALFGVGGQVGMMADKARGVDSQALPPDLQAKLDAGATVDQIAEELVNRGEGFTSDTGTNAGTNLAAQMVLDPLNLISGGAAAGLRGVRGAGIAVRSADELQTLGLGQRSVGTIYNAATRGLDQAGGALMDRVVGPVTSGVFHTLGTKSYKAMVGGASRLDRQYGINAERAFALGAGQMPRAVIAREMMQDVGSKLARKGDVESTLANRMRSKLTTSRDELERRTEELLGRVTPAFPIVDEKVTNETIRKYAAYTGMSVEDATQVLGKVDRNMARTAHLSYYGHAGGELAELKKVIPSSKKLDVERLTVIAPDTLTDELADAIIAGDISPVDAVENFSVLSNHFGGKIPSDADVLAFIDKIRDTLPEAVKLPKTGKNALPKELGDWRARNQEFGYDLGFAPKDGWKAIVDENGDTIMSDPFVHFVSDVDPVTMRNPLGRFMDGLMRGTTQTVIVQQSRERMVDFLVRNKVPISPNEVRSLHKQILEEAADRGVTPRALAGERTAGGTLYDDIFRRTLSADAYKALTDKFDPTYVVMKAFQGNWQTVGLTQKFTGAAKASPVGGKKIAEITESLYPKARFTYRPTFQAQEVIESPVFNALRGVTDREVPADLLDAYRALAEQPEFRYLTEAQFLNIAGIRRTEQFMGANTKVGRAMGRFANIQGRKETLRIRQVMYEHGDDFKEAVQKINPKFWKAMEEAYDTTDARAIADRFLAERLALGTEENIDKAMGLIDEAVDGADDVYYHGTAKGAGEAIEREGFDASRFGTRDRGPMAEPDYRGVYVTKDKGKATNYYSTSAPSATNDVLGGGDVVRVRIDKSKLTPIEKWREFKTQAKINLLDENGDLPGGINSQAVLDEQVRLAQEAGYIGATMRAGEETLIFNPADAQVVRSAGARIQAAYDAGDTAAGQAQNIAEGVRRGGSAASGGAMKAEGALPSSASEMVLQAFKDSFRQSSIRAFQTHFFNPQRGWLERSLNHPYLGLYPLSYMWGKVLPEFSRFLVKRPFGVNAPLVGLANLERVQQAYLGALADDPEFAKYMDENEDAIYFANLLFPGNPVNMAVNAPAWARHVGEDAAAGKLKDPAKTAVREIVDSSSYAFGPAHDLTSVSKTGADLADIGQDIFEMLTKSAAQYDGQFPTGAPPEFTGTPLTP